MPTNAFITCPQCNEKNDLFGKQHCWRCGRDLAGDKIVDVGKIVFKDAFKMRPAFKKIGFWMVIPIVVLVLVAALSEVFEWMLRGVGLPPYVPVLLALGTVGFLIWLRAKAKKRQDQ